MRHLEKYRGFDGAARESVEKAKRAEDIALQWHHYSYLSCFASAEHARTHWFVAVVCLLAWFRNG